MHQTRNLYKDLEIFIQIAESSKKFKVRVYSDTRLKDIANTISRMMQLDPIRTDYTFFDSKPGTYYHFPLSFTVKQTKVQSGGTIVAKLLKTVEHPRDKVELYEREMFGIFASKRMQKPFSSTQTKYVPQGANRSKFEDKEAFKNMDRIVQCIQKQPLPIHPLKLKDNAFKVIDQEKEPFKWDNLKDINNQRIFNGLNLVARCFNKRCICYNRWYIVSMGTGDFDIEDIHSKVYCQTCPYRDMSPSPMRIKGFFFKECVWIIKEVKSYDKTKPTPLALSKWAGKEFKYLLTKQSPSLERHDIEDSMFDKGFCHLTFRVKPIDQLSEKFQLYAYNDKKIAP